MTELADIELRPASEVMRLGRMGAMFPTRLSFLRSLIRRLAREETVVERQVWNICPDGFGHAVYTLDLGGHRYSLVAVSTDLPDDQRTDRVIATAWDSSYVLFDGVPDAADIARICTNAPLQEAGRFGPRDLVLSRANKSVRLFAHVVERLRSGQQPDADMIAQVGYLMRTTAVYGNGKFGIADRAAISDRPGLSGPFAAEMLTVWLIRHFTHDLVEHVAGGARLDRRLKRHLGIGNSTGLGMAPFLVSHPVLLNNWMLARETALVRVRALPKVDPARIGRLMDLGARAARHLGQWSVPDPVHQARIERLRADWDGFIAQMGQTLAQGAYPIDRLLATTHDCSLDLQELAVALVLEPFGDLVDGLEDCMSDPFGPLCPQITDTAALGAVLRRDWGWALGLDYSDPANCGQFWYVSAAKQEPRLGDRFAESGSEWESPLDIARRIKALFHDLPDKAEPLDQFLARMPDHGLAVVRAEIRARYPYAEIHDNLIAQSCLPIDMLRCKLAFFGASKFDPKSDRWTRITLCQGAPLADELSEIGDDWWLPVFA